MGRVVRTLMKVPAVRRVMVRLANVEAAIAKHQASLDALENHRERLSADQASQHAKLQEATAFLTQVATNDQFQLQQAHVAKLRNAVQIQQAQIDALLAQQNQVTALGDAVQIQRTQIDALLAQQTQAATFDDVIRTQQTQIDALLAQQNQAATFDGVIRTQQEQIDVLLAKVRELAADRDKYSSLLAEVSQHLPPAQRANLEATLHGQQLQLGALNSTVNAQQMQLAALNDVVGRIISGQEGKPAAVIDAGGGNRGDQPSTVGHRAHELLQLGGGKGTVYRFDDLLQRQESPAPPLIFLHVPKAAGSTLNSVFMKNYKFRSDSRGDSFFSRYTPRELIDLASVPRSEDDRTRPGFFTGHIDLDNEIFRSMPARYVAITLLRDPIERAISHYRFNSTQPSVFQDAIRDENLSVIDYCRKFAGAIATQYTVFAPHGGVEVALRRLQDEVSFFGLQSEFEQCVEALGRLLGLPTKTYKMLNMTPTDAVGITQSEVSELQSLFADDITFYNRAVEIYRERLTKIPKLVAEHHWTKFYS